MALENSITQNILKYLNSLPYCTAEKIKGSSSSSGKADIGGCIRGTCFRIEVKTPDNRNKTSKKQELNLKRWKSSGALVVVTYSLDFVTLILTRRGIKNFGSGYVAHPEVNGCISWAEVIYVKERGLKC